MRVLINVQVNKVKFLKSLIERLQNENEVKTKTTIELIYDILAPNLSLVFRIIIG